MNNKKSIYFLLPIVVFIWAIVIYEFFGFSNPNNIISTTHEANIKPFKIKKKDTFVIKINKRDPFLGKLIVEDTTYKKIKASSDKIVKVKEEIIWPKVQYKGIVSDDKEKIKVYMVIINGKSFLMHKSEEQSGVKLKEGDRETIYVGYMDDTKVVYIQ